MQRLKGKTILLVGGGRIGGGIARRYAREGANLVLGDIDLDGARDLAAEIELTGGQVLAARVDGTDESSIAAGVDLACETFGGLDGMHANFASFADSGFDKGLLDISMDEFDESMRVNARGFVLCTRCALPAIIAQGGGSIVYTSSAGAYLGLPTQVSYAMSKAAELALMRHVAARHGADGVRANAIAPGAMLQPRRDELPAEQIEHLLSIALIKSRLGDPADIGAISALLMSEDGAYITGQTICVDGGVTMRA